MSTKLLKNQRVLGPRNKSTVDLLPIFYQTYLKDKIENRVLINGLLDSNDVSWTGSSVLENTLCLQKRKYNLNQ